MEMVYYDDLRKNKKNFDDHFLAGLKNKFTEEQVKNKLFFVTFTFFCLALFLCRMNVPEKENLIRQFRKTDVC